MRSATERRSGTEWRRVLSARPACCVRSASPTNWPRRRPFHGAADARCSAKRWVFSCEVAHFWLVGACVSRLSDFLNFRRFRAVGVSRGGRMSVGNIRIITNNQKYLRLFNLNEVSRRSIVILQMLGDGLIMTMLSYLSFSFVTHLHSDSVPPQPFPYVASTIGTTTILIGISACSGVYDVFDEFRRFEVLKSTVKCVAVMVLILTATLF